MARRSAYAAICTLGLWVAGTASAHVEEVLEQCLNASLSQDARVSALTAAGWSDTTTVAGSVMALQEALLLANLSPTADAATQETRQAWADELGEKLRAHKGLDGVDLLEAPDAKATVVFEERRDGLPTCMYVAEIVDMAPIIALSGHPTPPTIEGRQVLRSTIPGGRISAFGWDDEALAQLPRPTKYSFTFTTVLDRRDAGSFGE